MITSLLEMQARQVNDPPALSLLTEARNRVSAIGTIHELMYQSGSLSRVDLLGYARRLLPHIVSLYERTVTIGLRDHVRVPGAVGGDVDPGFTARRAKRRCVGEPGDLGPDGRIVRRPDVHGHYLGRWNCLEAQIPREGSLRGISGLDAGSERKCEPAPPPRRPGR